MKPADRQLLRDVKDSRIVHQGDPHAGYDWNERTGRDVTAQMRRLELAQLVSRVGSSITWRWRPTKLGHTMLAANAVEVAGG
jgi:hypothetical protein